MFDYEVTISTPTGPYVTKIKAKGPKQAREQAEKMPFWSKHINRVLAVRKIGDKKKDNTA